MGHNPIKEGNEKHIINARFITDPSGSPPRDIRDEIYSEFENSGYSLTNRSGEYGFMEISGNEYRICVRVEGAQETGYTIFCEMETRGEGYNIEDMQKAFAVLRESVHEVDNSAECMS